MGLVIMAPIPAAPDARMTVDGVPRGALPAVLRLRPGRHRIQFMDPGGLAIAPRETTLVVAAGQTTSVFPGKRRPRPAAPRGPR
jgi:hypothetical protein